MNRRELFKALAGAVIGAKVVSALPAATECYPVIYGELSDTPPAEDENVIWYTYTHFDGGWVSTGPLKLQQWR